MTMSSPEIVHEADAQRQHIRVPLPAKIKINNQDYSLRDWSIDGACIELAHEGQKNDFKIGSKYDAVFNFNLGEFSLTLPITAIVHHIDEKENLVGLRYVDLSQEKITVIRQLVNAYVNGEITSAGEIIHVTGRDNFVKSRKLPVASNEDTPNKVSRFIKTGIIMLISLFMLSYIFTNIYERSYVIVANNAVISGDELLLKSPTGGSLNYTNLYSGDKIKKNAAIMTITSSTGALKGVDSPCDCIISRQIMASGSNVSQGDAIITMVPQGSKLYIDAYLPYEEAVNLAEGQIANISIANENINLTGVIKDIKAKTLGGSTYTVRIVTKKQIPEYLIGTPAIVTIDTSGWFRKSKNAAL